MADEDRDDLMQQAAGEFNPDDEFGDEPESSQGGGKKKFIFILLGFLIIAGGGAGAYFSGIFDSGSQEEEKVAVAPPPPPEETIFYDLPDMLVNLDSAGGRPAYLKIRASLELSADTDTFEVKELRPRIVDKFQTYLRELRLEDFKGGAGSNLLRHELRIRINAVIAPLEVKDVLFRNMLIQ
jgi:flagellar FliL protein